MIGWLLFFLVSLVLSFVVGTITGFYLRSAVDPARVGTAAIGSITGLLLRLFPVKKGRVMTDMLQKGQEWLASKLTQHASRQVVYRRGELGATLQATIGKSMYDQDDGEGIVTRSQVRDFLIDTYALLSSIIGTLPRRGDTIVEIDGDHTFIFEVMALGGDPPWRYSDPFRLKLRIHTKQIESHPS